MDTKIVLRAAKSADAADKLIQSVQDDAPAIFSGARAKLGVTQAEMARRLGTPVSYLCRVERGVTPPGVELVRKLAKIISE